MTASTGSSATSLKHEGACRSERARVESESIAAIANNMSSVAVFGRPPTPVTRTLPRSLEDLTDMRHDEFEAYAASLVRGVVSNADPTRTWALALAAVDPAELEAPRKSRPGAEPLTAPPSRASSGAGGAQPSAAAPRLRTGAAESPARRFLRCMRGRRSSSVAPAFDGIDEPPMTAKRLSRGASPTKQAADTSASPSPSCAKQAFRTRAAKLACGVKIALWCFHG